ncbi:hypothetical protein AQI88_34850 [Streptomyces cellostaticus]|uniref:Nuclear transport factor 2 family protein n=1 Tax=Streptomyces cellostaticus TaxID=67285 RepID=A0A117PU29_9ACTN|nr:hypothetical protein [Streptomyces cellostaticus]KUM91775.1 hypothetical protein AQI88_34850 [Streptomyces cellostaticus]
MSWTRRTLTALAVCVLLPFGAAGCGTGGAHGHGSAVSPSPVGKVLGDTDDTGRHLREVDKKNAPGVGIEVTPDQAGGWDVLLTLRHFRFSPAGVRPRALPARGLVYLLVDGRLVSRLRAHGYHLADRLVPHGTHHVTARLYADDGTVWAVHGKPVESTADITASGAETDSATPPSGEGSADPSEATVTVTVGP